MKELILTAEFVYTTDERLLSIRGWREGFREVGIKTDLGQCFRNSFLLMTAFREDIQYVEGWCLSPEGQALDHAWNYIPRLNLFLDITAEIFYTSFAVEYHPFYLVNFNDFTRFQRTTGIAFKPPGEATYVPLRND